MADGIQIREVGIDPLEAVFANGVRRFDQSGEYKAAVEKLAKGEVAAGFEKLDELGWVKEISPLQLRTDDQAPGQPKVDAAPGTITRRPAKKSKS